MTPTEEFIRGLESLEEGERSLLRRLAGQRLDHTLNGFDLFTSLWWPLRENNRAAPRREPSWLVAKLFSSFPLPQIGIEGARLPAMLGRVEPLDDRTRGRFRARFETLLQTTLSSLEPHLRWALSVVSNASEKSRVAGIDWAQLLDDISVWDRGDIHRRRQDIGDIWAKQYLDAVELKKARVHRAY